MADLRDLIYRQRNRRVGQSSNPITRSPGVREMPFGRGTATPQPTNPYNAPSLSSTERELAQRYTSPLNPDPYVQGVEAGTQQPQTRGFGGTETTTPTATAAPAPVFGANISPQEKYLRDDLDAYYARRKKLAEPVEDDDSKLHNFGAGAAHALRQVQRTGNSQADLGETVGAAVFGGLRGLFTKKEDDIRDRKKENDENEKLIERGEKQVDKEIERGYKQAQTQNIYDDNAFNKEKLAQKKEADAEKIIETKRKNFYSKNKYFDPATASPAQRRELEGFGETPESVGKYDFSKPDFKQIGGVTYKYNKATGAFEDTNLPKDDAKSIVDYEITDADGIKRTFRTTNERAAGLITSTKNAKMQIEAAELRQDKTIERDIQFKEVDRRDKLKQFKEQKKMKRADLAKELEIRVNDGKISPDVRDQILRDFDN